MLDIHWRKYSKYWNKNEFLKNCIEKKREPNEDFGNSPGNLM